MEPAPRRGRDERERASQITAIKKGTTTLASYGYDSAGRLSTRTLANGLTTHYSYNSMSRLTQLTVTGPGGTLWAQRYGFNLSGQRIHTLAGSSGTLGDAYKLDATGQLTGVKYEATGADGGYASATNPSSTATWGYDEVGNRTTQVDGAGTTTYTANDINQYTAIAGAQSQGPLTYSTRGDLIENGDWTYTFDADGNLIRAHNSQSNLLAKYWRDAAGHLAVKDIDGQKTLYFNFGFWPLEAYDLTAETARSTIYAPGLDNPLCEINDDGSIRFFYHQDWLGNVTLLTDAAGAKLQSYTYDVWGEPSGFDASGNPIAASAFESRFLFTGREYDPETGLYHYRARAYSPSLGRFLQFDPIDFAAGDVNLLRYAGNQPTGLVDPLGLEECDPNDPDDDPNDPDNHFKKMILALIQKHGFFGFKVNGGNGPGFSLGVKASQQGLTVNFGIGVGIGLGVSGGPGLHAQGSIGPQSPTVGAAIIQGSVSGGQPLAGGAVTLQGGIGATKSNQMNLNGTAQAQVGVGFGGGASLTVGGRYTFGFD